MANQNSSLSLKKFRSWLETKNPRTKIGAPGDCVACPIAKFLTQTTGVSHHVDAIQYGPQPDNSGLEYGDDAYDLGDVADGKEKTTPKWAEQFIYVVDHSDGASVSASRALTILNAIDRAKGRFDEYNFTHGE